MPAVDPLIRLVSLIVFSVCLAFFAGFAQLGASACLLVVAWVVRRHGPSLTAWRLLRRSKWLLLSLAVVYLALVPGAPLLPSMSAGVPSIEGAQQAALRAGAIVMLVFSVDIAFFGLSSEGILAAFFRFIRPWGWLGFSPERVAVRGWLTLRYVTEGRVVDPWPSAKVNSARVSLAEGVEMAAARLEQVLAAEPQITSPIRVDVGSSAPAWQWALPVGLAILFAWISWI